MRLEIASTWDGLPARPDERVHLTLSATPAALRIAVDAPFHGDPPPPGAPGPCWRLWEHEVVELFVVGPDEHYTEVELSPHGHHLLLRLEGTRQVVEKMLPMDFSADIHGARWQGVALLPWDCLPPAPRRGNAFAIHGCGTSRRHLAASPLPGPQPDFHQLDRFPALRLPVP